MVGSSFILINKNGRRLLFNTAQISAVKNIDILLTDALRRHYWEIPVESDMAYVLRFEQPDGFTDLIFTGEAEREELYDKIIAAISPSAVLDSAPGLPQPWSELARMKPKPKSRYTLNGKEYDTFEEYWKAEQEQIHQEVMAEVLARSQSQAAALSISTPPPTKPPRKPYTRKPRE